MSESVDKNGLLAAMFKSIEFMEAEVVGENFTRVLASLVTDEDGIGAWHKVESNRILKELLFHIHGKFAKLFVHFSQRIEVGSHEDVSRDVTLLKKRVELLSTYCSGQEQSEPPKLRETITVYEAAKKYDASVQTIYRRAEAGVLKIHYKGTKNRGGFFYTDELPVKI